MTSSARSFGFAVFLAVALARLGTAVAGAQDAKPSPAPPYLTVGAVEASPGASVIVPVYYTPEPKTPVRSFTAEIEFVSNNLTFQDVAQGVIDADDLKITSSVATAQPDSNGVKHSKIRLAATLADKAKQGLHEGLVAYLMFNLSVEAKPFVIKLTPTIISAEDTQKPPRKIAKFGAQPGSVAVLSLDATPEMSCFFFTH